MANVSHRKPAFTVAPSPFNAVKFELGVILVVGIFLLLIQWHINDVIVQFLLLLVYGLLGMGWIVFRVYRVLTQSMAKPGHNRDEPQ